MRITLTIAGLGLLLSGCGPSIESASIVPVKGKLSKADGSPAKGYTVEFVPVFNPDKPGGAPIPTGNASTSDDGSFVAKVDGKEGLAAAKYKVVILNTKDKQAFPSKYKTADSSDLEFKVSGAEDNLDLKLTN